MGDELSQEQKRYVGMALDFEADLLRFICYNPIVQAAKDTDDISPIVLSTLLIIYYQVQAGMGLNHDEIVLRANKTFHKIFEQGGDE